MMAQYQGIKAENPDAVLFFRMGDFYETFFEDAAIVSKVLEITLTSRGEKDANGNKIPLAGFPYHALDAHLYKMIQAGHKVAICEQVEDPKLARGVVKRAVIRVVTPGTVTDPKALDGKANNFIVALYAFEKRFGLACADVSTGEFQVTEPASLDKLATELTRLRPSELLLPEGFRHRDALAEAEEATRPTVNEQPPWQFDPETARGTLLRHFQSASLDGFGCEGLHAAVGAAGALMTYLLDTQKDNVHHVTGMTTYSTESFMALDGATQRNLELVRSMRDGSTHGTLLQILDGTLTPMGARKLRQAIVQPLLDAREIRSRLDAVAELRAELGPLDDLRALLKGVYDVERLVGRIGLGSANARDLQALGGSLAILPALKDGLSTKTSSLLATLHDSLDTCADVVGLISRAVHEEPPLTLRDGRLIRDGNNGDLDELRDVLANGKDRIARLQEAEREATGITSLKVGYNQVFGYYIEVTRANLANVPESYIRKQTLANAERYITPELKEFEEKILNAQERILDLEYDLFLKVREQVKAEIPRIQRAAAILAMLDFLSAMAYIAVKNNYVKPQVDDTDALFIKSGRHPVVEQLVTHEGFVPNDTHLNCDEEQLQVITGPNMSGKSTYLRQVALITLMAQMGSFVPAAEAHLGVVDRIFTRVGAADNLAMGQSTFLVEMNETANILNNATSRSLLILDEIGRGTSTFDGISIAWAVAEYILSKVGAKTLFATHYHELIELAEKSPRVRNYNVAIHEDEDSITFLRKVVEGGTDDSYGIHVARLAGLPDDVVARAMDILLILEQHEISVGDNSTPRPRRRPRRRATTDGGLQLSLFVPPSSGAADPLLEELRDELSAMDLDAMTPIEALNALHALRKKLDGTEAE
ncbi:DNA mismatch repair protein MutS [Candidatus Poribacteria bacterium]|nr:DNA mismatch repair protein MutS [Candidatus Poribacteria bacterium]